MKSVRFASVLLFFDKIRRKVEKTRQSSVWCSSQHLHLSRTLLHTSLTSKGIKDCLTYDVVEGCRLRPTHSVLTLVFSPLPQDNFKLHFQVRMLHSGLDCSGLSCGGHTSSEQILENPVHGPVHSPAFTLTNLHHVYSIHALFRSLNLSTKWRALMMRLCITLPLSLWLSNFNTSHQNELRTIKKINGVVSDLKHEEGKVCGSIHM